MDFAPGTQVTSVVRLVRPLGRGGMGAVWVAEHQTLKTEVVVKFMSEALASDAVSLARFSREASAAAAVKSPHVVQMFDHGFAEDGTPFIVMELLDGDDLRKRLVRDGVVPLPELAIIIAQACKALARAHAAGIVHRDIKPDNIFLCDTDDGEPFVKILDFGIAKSASSSDFHMTQTGVMMGTPFYMSPEQAVGSPPVDFTTDLWSLGVVAFEAMTGSRPFDGPTIGALTIAICSERAPVPSQSNPQIPSAIDAWLARACARDRAERFPDARTMGDALLAAVRGSTLPGAVPLAFEATSLSRGSDRPPKPTNPPATSPAPAVPAASETAGGLATTTSPLSHTRDAPLAQPAQFEPVNKSLGRPAASGRGPYLAVGAALIVLGVVGGVLVAQRDGDQPLTPPVLRAAAGPATQAPSAEPTHTPVTNVEALPRVPDVHPLASVAPPRAPPAPPLPVGAAPRGPVNRVAPNSTPAAPPVAAIAPAAIPPGCDPPFYFDAAHTKVFKKECL